MRIYDMHMHSSLKTPPAPEALLASMAEVGIYGACIYSAAPKENKKEECAEYEARLDHVLRWCDGYAGRLFPVLWIHPDERGIRKKVHDAAERGIAAFKIIPYDHHADSKKSLRLMHEIAETGKPVVFHSGILWNDGPSAKYLHPASYEGLLTVPNLRFALAHCSWPWMDECLAMFGKINYTRRAFGRSAEMFIDITPGAHGFYRRMLFERLYGNVYDATKHTLFGIDCTANTYNAQYARNTLATDNALYEEFGVSEAVRQAVYEDNLFRFLGIEKA